MKKRPLGLAELLNRLRLISRADGCTVTLQTPADLTEI
jgi:hypothetical protein